MLRTPLLAMVSGVMFLVVASLGTFGDGQTVDACPYCMPQPKEVSIIGMLVDLEKMSFRSEVRDRLDHGREPREPEWALITQDGRTSLILAARDAGMVTIAKENTGKYVTVNGIKAAGSEALTVTEIKQADPQTFELVGHLRNFDIGFDVTSRPGLVFQYKVGDETHEVLVGNSDVDLQPWLDRRNRHQGSAAPTPRMKITVHYEVRYRSGFSERHNGSVSWGEVVVRIVEAEDAPAQEGGDADEADDEEADDEE